VTLRFQRWLAVDRPVYGASTQDQAFISVSTDGNEFTTIWQNPARILDRSWQAQEFDLSSLVDGEPTVYLRWTMGPTNSATAYGGWNLDDIQLWAMAPADTDTTVPGPVQRVVLMPNYPNPFWESTTIPFSVTKAGRVQLDIFDMRGRLIRRLLDKELGVTERDSTEWDGTDEDNRLVPSGTYLCRLRAGRLEHERKIMVVR
jgi:hypothetical protein